MTDYIISEQGGQYSVCRLDNRGYYTRVAVVIDPGDVEHLVSKGNAHSPDDAFMAAIAIIKRDWPNASINEADFNEPSSNYLRGYIHLAQGIAETQFGVTAAEARNLVLSELTG